MVGLNVYVCVRVRARAGKREGGGINYQNNSKRNNYRKIILRILNIYCRKMTLEIFTKIRNKIINQPHKRHFQEN